MKTPALRATLPENLDPFGVVTAGRNSEVCMTRQGSNASTNSDSNAEQMEQK